MITLSTPMIVGGAAALLGGAYLLSKKDDASGSQTLDQKINSVISGNASSSASSAGNAVQNVVMDGASAEYNMARERYRMVAGSYPPQSWTIEMINVWIEEQSRKEELLKQYISFVAANSDYVQQENTSNMTYQQIQALITKAQNEVKKNKEAERVKILAGTAKSLADAYRATLLAPNYYNLCLGGQNAWDTATLQAMIDLSKEGKQYCEYYFEQGGAVKLPGYFNQIGSAWKEYKTIASCVLDSNTNTGRRGASLAKTMKDAFQGISAVAPKVGADGSISSSRPAINPLIAFHLREHE